MDYKTFIINSLIRNDISSLKKYEKLTKKLVNNRKLNKKYLLVNNIKLIKQYGGIRDTTVKVIRGKDENGIEYQVRNPKENNNKNKNLPQYDVNIKDLMRERVVVVKKELKVDDIVEIYDFTGNSSNILNNELGIIHKFNMKLNKWKVEFPFLKNKYKHFNRSNLKKVDNNKIFQFLKKLKDDKEINYFTILKDGKSFRINTSDMVIGNDKVIMNTTPQITLSFEELFKTIK